MGLDELKPFVAEEKIIEDVLESRRPHSPLLVDLSARKFAETTAGESPAPGGGSVSAYMGALGAALGAMVANLAAHKAGWDDRWEEFSNLAVEGQTQMERLLHLTDRDTDAFNAIMNAYGMPKGSDEERERRTEAIRQALIGAVQIPFETLQQASALFSLLRNVALEGNPASASDAGVGALAARAAVHGALLNMRINAADIKPSSPEVERMLAEANDLAIKADAAEAEILEIVNNKIAGK